MSNTAEDDGSRLGDLIDELKAKITEIKSVVQPAWEQLSTDVRAHADELSAAIDAKVDEIQAAWAARGDE